MNRFRPWVPLAVLAIVWSGCRGAEEFPEEEPEVADTASAFQGLSPDEIRTRAEPMSPAVAESLGIIDTTIHVEDPVSDDSLIPPQMRDTLR
jgi:hypothetical protein